MNRIHVRGATERLNISVAYRPTACTMKLQNTTSIDGSFSSQTVSRQDCLFALPLVGLHKPVRGSALAAD